MATEYFSDNEAYISNEPLPSPADTPYHSLSRRTSRYGSPISEPPSSPAPFPPEPFEVPPPVMPRNSGNFSMIDPKRFTPTLHASLVSEILNLRRELDSKHTFIEDLETTLHTVKNENEALTAQLNSSSREGRAVKGQLQQLESATMSALEEIANDRNQLTESNADLKSKLDAAQKKLRSQEEDSNRVHDMWSQEKDAWAGEKRALERRVHISETRLKLLLEELANHEEAREADNIDSDGEGLPRDSGLGQDSDAGSVRSSPVRRPSTRIARHSRNISNSSFRSFGRGYRMSLISGTGSEGQGRGNGMSLADELIFDEEEEDLDDLELDSDDFPENELRALRALESRQSMRQDDKAKRILGLSLDSEMPGRDSSPVLTESEPPKSMFHSLRSSSVLPPQAATLIFPPPSPKSIEPPVVEPVVESDIVETPRYVDTGVQPSPPPSPERPQTSESALTFKLYEAITSKEVEANQRKKRVSAASSPPPMPRLMTSASSQTSDQPLSPPATPKVEGSFDDVPLPTISRPELVSTATQTESVDETEKQPAPSTPPSRAPPPVPISVPSIAIFGPSSVPSSPRDPKLPPGTKSISTQTSIELRTEMRTVGMQTEPIMVDWRLNKLPHHLLPSSITSKPGTPVSGQESSSWQDAKIDATRPANAMSTAVPSARQDLKALLERTTKIENRYPGNNDNGPLAENKNSSISRPFRSSSLFAGFGGASSDEEEEESDEETTRQCAPPLQPSRAAKSGKVGRKPPTPVPEEKEPSPSPVHRLKEAAPLRVSTRTSMDKPARVGKASLSRQPSIRRSAMIQSGTSAHMRARSRSRSRSPSSVNVGTNNAFTKPPFPVPARSSSRRPAQSKSEGSQSPTPRNSGSGAGRRPYGTRQPQRQDSLRKVRSAAVIARSARPRSRSPPLPATPTIPPSPSLPPIPSDMSVGYRHGHRRQLSTTTVQTAQTMQTGSGSAGSSVGYQTGVVDAIAATMVGEWMWKYVRKGKAFGGQESSADIARAEEAVTTVNGARHKRWVWISPYERSVLWSHKQPTTGPALLGKSGRKLVIQSVLDVVDNTPIPRNAGTQVLFNRSILILTPARALKFTATSRERHYLWLTALSFLAHSSTPIPDLGPAPLAPPQEEEPVYRPAGATLRRSRVQDSVRLAKGKANPVAARYQASMEPMPELHSEYADPPAIPRGPIHSRKRSSTGPLAPRPTQPYRAFSHQHVPSTYSSGSSDMYSSRAPPSVPSSVYNPHSGIGSTRTSEASNSTRQHFFDTMGTVRMEAFIDDSLGKDPSLRAAAAPGIGRRRGNQWINNEPTRAGGLFEDMMLESNDRWRDF